MREIADATVWLFGEAAGYVTGTVMVGEFAPISFLLLSGLRDHVDYECFLVFLALFSLSVIALSSFRGPSIYFPCSLLPFSRVILLLILLLVILHKHLITKNQLSYSTNIPLLVDGAAWRMPFTSPGAGFQYPDFLLSDDSVSGVKGTKKAKI